MDWQNAGLTEVDSWRFMEGWMDWTALRFHQCHCCSFVVELSGNGTHPFKIELQCTILPNHSLLLYCSSFSCTTVVSSLFVQKRKGRTMIKWQRSRWKWQPKKYGKFLSVGSFRFPTNVQGTESMLVEEAELKDYIVQWRQRSAIHPVGSLTTIYYYWLYYYTVYEKVKINTLPFDWTLKIILFHYYLYMKITHPTLQYM